MKVREVMKYPVISITPETTYEEAARIMRSKRFSGLPVVSPAGELIGLVSEKDLFRALYPSYEEFIANPELWTDQENQEAEIERLRETPVSLYMARHVYTISPEAPVLHAAGLMLARQIHRLPVLENKKLVGMVTRREIFGAVLISRLGVSEAAAAETVAAG